MGKTLDQPQANGISCAIEDNRDTVCSHLRSLGRRRVIGEKNIDPLLHEFSRGLGKSRNITLGESDPDHEILVFTITPILKSVAEADHAWRGSPGISQHSDKDRLSTLRGTDVTNEQRLEGN